jgi:hypothetical protein
MKSSGDAVHLLLDRAGIGIDEDVQHRNSDSGRPLLQA